VVLDSAPDHERLMGRVAFVSVAGLGGVAEWYLMLSSVLSSTGVHWCNRVGCSLQYSYRALMVEGQ
jgi:hypothetical protein